MINLDGNFETLNETLISIFSIFLTMWLDNEKIKNFINVFRFWFSIVVK